MPKLGSVTRETLQDAEVGCKALAGAWLFSFLIVGGLLIRGPLQHWPLWTAVPLAVPLALVVFFTVSLVFELVLRLFASLWNGGVRLFRRFR